MVRKLAVALSFLVVTGCGTFVDQNAADVSWTPDLTAIYDFEKNELASIGIVFLEERKPGTGIVTRSELNPVVLETFALENPYYVRSARLAHLRAYIEKVDAFLTKHDKFLKSNTGNLYRRFEKTKELVNGEIERASDLAEDSIAAAKTEAEDLTEEEATLDFLELTVSKGQNHDTKAFAVSSNDLSEITEEQQESLDTFLENLENFSDEYQEDLISNILEAKIQAVSGARKK